MTESTVREPTKRSPISYLPPELLVTIFTFTLPYLNFIPSIRSIRELCPLILTEVCKSWRALALSTPELWQRLAFWQGDVSYTPENMDALSAGVKTWFSRSGTLKVSLFATLDGESFIQGIEERFQVPWGRLTSLELTNCCLCPFLIRSVLAQSAPSIVYCRLVGLRYTDGTLDQFKSIPAARIVLPQLKVLFIEFFHTCVERGRTRSMLYTKISPFLDLLRLPSLEDLSLLSQKPHYISDDALPAALLEHQRDARPPLRCLHLSDVIMDDPLPLVQFIRETPSMRAIHIRPRVLGEFLRIHWLHLQRQYTGRLSS